MGNVSEAYCGGHPFVATAVSATMSLKLFGCYLPEFPGLLKFATTDDGPLINSD